MPSAFKQVEEKHVAVEMEQLLWSPKMDLIASSNVNGEVILYRLSWQKVWSMVPGSEGTKVKSMSWRPDGKVLAVAYDSGEVLICFVENASVLHRLSIPSVSCLCWISHSEKQESTETRSCFEEKASEFLPKLPNFPKAFSGNLAKGQNDEDVEDSKKLLGIKELNILVVGTDLGDMFLYSFGVSLMCISNLEKADLTGVTGLVACGLSNDLKLLNVMVETENKTGKREVHYLTYDTNLLALRHKELGILGMKYSMLLTLCHYVDTTVQQMQEASEDILREMESKLMKLAEEKEQALDHSGPISNDFLKLLLFGNLSSELQNFLQHDLTERGLKKLGHSIENSYSNIQKLVLKHLQSVAQAFVYHLSEVKGMSRWYEKFGILGLSTPTVNDALKAAGSFMLKAIEIQQVIDSGMKNFKAFFRWLYVVLLRLSDEPVPTELSKMTQQDCSFVAQFLKENFTEESSQSVSGFKLEKVGQYLKLEDLTDPPSVEGNPWVQFLEENPAVKDCSILYPSQTNKSLVQVQQDLKNKINLILETGAAVIGDSITCVNKQVISGIDLNEDVNQNFIVTQISDDGDVPKLKTAFLGRNNPCYKCYLFQHETTEQDSLQGVGIEFNLLNLDTSSSNLENSFRATKHRILDVAFYDKDTLSVLLLEENDVSRTGISIITQIPLHTINSEFYTPINSSTSDIKLDDLQSVDLGVHVESVNSHRLDNMVACRMAVSGTRKVACVLLRSKRHVRLFMMDADDDEDDDDDPTSTRLLFNHSLNIKITI